MADIGELQAHIGLNMRGLHRDINRAEGMFRRFSTTAVRSLSRISSSMLSMGKTAAFIGGAAGIGALAAGLFKATKVGMGFELTMKTVGGVMRATEKEMEALTAIAREMGEKTEFSASQAGEGLKFLGMAGFNAAKAIKALPGVIDLATSKTLDLGRAADISTNILDAMGIKVERLSHLNDVLVGTTNRVNVDIQGLADGFRMGASVASDFNVSLEQLSAWIGLLGGKGIPGQMAGRQLAVGIIEAAKAAKELNLQSSNYLDVLEELGKRGETGAAIYERFGLIAGRAASQMQKIIPQARALTAELVNIGPEAKILADTIRGTLTNKVKEFFSALESSAIDAFTEYKEQLRDGIEKMTAFVREHKGFATAIANSAVKIIQYWRGVARIDLTETELKLANIGTSIATAAEAMGRLLAKLGELALWVERNMGVITAIGALTGAKIGAGIGAFAGPKGMLIGTAVGALTGGFGTRMLTTPRPGSFLGRGAGGEAGGLRLRNAFGSGGIPIVEGGELLSKELLPPHLRRAVAGGGAESRGARAADILGDLALAESGDDFFDLHIQAWFERQRRLDAIVEKARRDQARFNAMRDKEILDDRLRRERLYQERIREGITRTAKLTKTEWGDAFTSMIAGARTFTDILFNAVRLMDRVLGGGAAVGAGIGGIMGALTGQGGIGSTIGGGIGGFLGKKAGEDIGWWLGERMGGISGGIKGDIFGGIVGTVLGSVGGSLLGGLFGGGKKKDPVRAAIRQWVSTELWPELDKLRRMGFGLGPFGQQNFPGSAAGRPGGSDFFKLAGFEQGIPQQWLKRMKRMAASMQDILGNALSDAFEAGSKARAFKDFLGALGTGIADYIEQGIIKGFLKGSAFTRAVAPIIEGSEAIFKQLGKGKISTAVAETRLGVVLDQAMPDIKRLQPVVELLHDLIQNVGKLVPGGNAGGSRLIESLPPNIQITVLNNGEKSGIDIGREIQFGIEQEMNRVR